MDYRLQQEANNTLQEEIGTIRKPWSDNIAVALTYANTYYVGMSNLGFQTIYGFLNDRDDVCCERAFLPNQAAIARHQRTKTPLFSLESQTPLSAFDIVAFSVAFENDYLNILRILQLAHIPLKAEERDESSPLVILGGAITTINPEPLAMFIDLFVVGDGEDTLARSMTTYRQWAGTTSRQELLEHLAELPGVYVPSLYTVSYDAQGGIERRIPQGNAPEIIEQHAERDLAKYPAYSRILTENTEFGSMFLLQLNRGCCYQCRFCHTGYTQRPLRHLPFETATRLIEHGLQHRKRIGLVGAAVADYPQLEAICAQVASNGGQISASSLRLSALSRSEYLLDALVQAGQKTLTVAPEAGTERLRQFLRKGLPDALLYEVIDHVLTTHIPNLKLYFLIGVPTETDEDLDAIIEVCRTCHEIMLKSARKRGTIGKITVSVNPLVPKPFTPLQWCAMDREATLKHKLSKIKRGLQRIGNVEMIHEQPKWAIWQGILARGDRKLGEVLLRTLEYRGNWKKAFQDLNLRPEFYAYRNREIHETFPWSHLHVGLSHQRLADEYQRILMQGTSRDAVPPSPCCY